MAAIDPHQMVTCPYNTAHQIEHYRLQFHLEKCRKQHTNSKKAFCPFDVTHVVNDVELNYHVTVCPKRGKFDREAYVMDDTPEFTPSAPPVTVVASADREENWDNDCYNSYQPEQALQNPNIIKKIKGATPSERRMARMEGIRNFKPPDSGRAGGSSN